MNIIELAKEAGLQSEFGVSEFAYTDRLERFAALVRAEVLKEDADLTIAYMVGYEKGKDALAEPVKQEPVAYVYEKDVAGIGMRKDVVFTKHVEVGTDLYAAPVDAKAIRAEALEEAAKVCEEEHDNSKFGCNGMHCAAAIRGLK